MYDIQDRPGCITKAHMRAYFERSVNDTKVFRENTPLNIVTINGEFSHYAHPDTDTDVDRVCHWDEVRRTSGAGCDGGAQRQGAAMSAFAALLFLVMCAFAGVSVGSWLGRAAWGCAMLRTRSGTGGEG